MPTVLLVVPKLRGAVPKLPGTVPTALLAMPRLLWAVLGLLRALPGLLIVLLAVPRLLWAVPRLLKTVPRLLGVVPTVLRAMPKLLGQCPRLLRARPLSRSEKRSKKNVQNQNNVQKSRTMSELYVFWSSLFWLLKNLSTVWGVQNHRNLVLCMACALHTPGAASRNLSTALNTVGTAPTTSV